MTEHEKWMQRAIDEARVAASLGDAAIGALIVRGDEVLGVGRNAKATEESGFSHAELNALLEAKPRLGRRPEGTVLYATLEPCAMCLGAVVFAGIRTVVFGAMDPNGGATEMFRAHPVYAEWMPEVIGGVLEKECAELMTLPTMRKSQEVSAE